jgi:methylated-DNA-protein-cysteine methyltransferase-like protein
MERGFYQEVYAWAAKIPAGKVATYGQLALLAGRPRSARQAGNALRRAPEGLPCHRVVNARGELAAAHIFGPGVQRELLLGENVRFLPDGRIDLQRCLWDGR